MRLRRLLGLAAALTALASVPAAAAADDDPVLAAKITPILRAHGLGGHGTGVAVVDVDTGETVFRRNSWRALMPASNEKLFTTVAALEQLGAGFRFTTRVVGAGTRVGSTWQGNIYLVGSGDPLLSDNDLAALARELHAAGIRRVSGRVLGDETIFDAQRYCARWKRAYFGIESPPLSGLAVDRDTAPSGQVVSQPPLSAARDFRKALVRHGIEVGIPYAAAGKAPVDAASLAAVSSPPLWRILRFMDQESDNFTAEMVLKAIGAYSGTAGSTDAGLAVVRTVLDQSLGDDATSLRPVDGSGLSRSNRATASAFAHLLAAAAEDNRTRSALYGSLSVAGVNGTLARRIPGVAGRVRAKTGTIDGVSSLSGYATTRTGRRYAFSILMNAPGLSYWQAHEAQDAIALLLANG